MVIQRSIQWLILGLCLPVVPANADDWTPKALLALARSNLPAHMVPRQVVVVDRLPLTASGKPDRRETIRLYAQND